MFVLGLILLHYKSFIGTPFHRNVRSLPYLKNHDIDSDEQPQIKFKPLRLNRKEFKEYRYSLNDILKINNNLMKHIENLQSAETFDDFPMYSLPSFLEVVNDISELRRNSKNHYVGEYEFIKFVEFYYYALFCIMKYEKRLLIDFYHLSKNSIVPILKELEKNVNSNQYNRMFDVLEDHISNHQKISAEIRHESLINFCLKFLEIQKVKIPENLIIHNFSMQDLLLRCLSLFIRFDLCYLKQRENFYERFSPLKNLISFQFQDFLFDNVLIVENTLQARIQLRKFLLNNNLNLERNLLDQNIIPPIFESVNENCEIFDLAPLL